MKLSFAPLTFVFVVTCVASACSATFLDSDEEDATTGNESISLRDAADNSVDEINFSDSIMVSLTNLAAATLYTVRVLDPNDSQLLVDWIFTSHDNGDLSLSPLFFFNGPTTQEDSSDAGLMLPAPDPLLAVLAGSYAVQLLNASATSVLATETFEVLDDGQEVAFAAAQNGVGQNAFLTTSGTGVYARWHACLSGDEADFYIVGHDGTVLENGDDLVNIPGDDAETGTCNAQERLDLSIWDAEDLVTGAYDLIVDRDQSGTFSSGDLIDGLGLDVGFTAVAAPSTGSHLRDQVAVDCQGQSTDVFDPSNGDPCTGAVFAAHFPLREPDTRHTYAAIYIVEHQESWGSGDGLDDVGAAERVALDWGSSYLKRTLVAAEGSLDPGCYDVVIDHNNNGEYNVGVDILDDSDNLAETTCGFRVAGADGAPSVAITTIVDEDGNELTSGDNTDGDTVLLTGTVASDVSTGIVFVRNTEGSGSLTGASYSVPLTITGNDFTTPPLPLFANAVHEITAYGLDSDHVSGSASVTVESDSNTSALDLEIFLIGTPTSNTDMDLHVVQPGGDFVEGGGGATDCNEENCTGTFANPSNLDWGSSSSESDNPFMDAICTDDCGGPEVFRLRAPEDTDDDFFEVYVDAEEASGLPTVLVFIQGTLVAQESLGSNLANGSSSDVWHVGSISWQGGATGRGSFVPCASGCVAGDF